MATWSVLSAETTMQMESKSSSAVRIPFMHSACAALRHLQMNGAVLFVATEATRSAGSATVAMPARSILLL